MFHRQERRRSCKDDAWENRKHLHSRVWRYILHIWLWKVYIGVPVKLGVVMLTFIITEELFEEAANRENADKLRLDSILGIAG